MDFVFLCKATNISYLTNLYLAHVSHVDVVGCMIKGPGFEQEGVMIMPLVQVLFSCVRQQIYLTNLYLTDMPRHVVGCMIIGYGCKQEGVMTMPLVRVLFSCV